jgi:hypothetical protein
MRPARRRRDAGIIELIPAKEKRRIQGEAEYLADLVSKTREPILEKDFERLLCLAVKLQQVNERGGNPG